MKITFRQMYVITAVVAVIAMNALANIIPFNGQTTAAVSNRLSNYFVPAGYVFAIWGVIYLGLILFAIFQALPSQATNKRLQMIRSWFLLSSVANIVWLLLWHFNLFALTVVVMLVLLGSLIMIYLGLHRDPRPTSSVEHWMVRIPFSIYLGWITVATIANISAALTAAHWDGFGIPMRIWFLIILAVVIILAALMTSFRKDVAYLLVLIWALIGIAVRPSDSELVIASSWAAAAAVSILLVYAFLKNRQQKV